MSSRSTPPPTTKKWKHYTILFKIFFQEIYNDLILYSLWENCFHHRIMGPYFFCAYNIWIEKLFDVSTVQRSEFFIVFLESQFLSSEQNIAKFYFFLGTKSNNHINLIVFTSVILGPWTPLSLLDLTLLCIIFLVQSPITTSNLTMLCSAILGTWTPPSLYTFG